MLSLSPSLRLQNEVAAQSIPSAIRSLPSDLALVAMAQELANARQQIAILENALSLSRRDLETARYNAGEYRERCASLKRQLACAQMREEISV